MSEFKDKSVIVSGSSSGIGEVIAITYASKGANVTLCGRDSQRLQDAAEKCKKAAEAAGYNIKTVEAAGDITDSRVQEEIIQKTVEAFGKLDILVVNHGLVLSSESSLDECTEENFDLTMNTNLKSALFLIKKAVQHLEKTRGSIVCVSSIHAKLSCFYMLSYNLSKVAMDHMVRCLSLQLGPKGIRINTVNPTWVHTQIARDPGSEVTGKIEIAGKLILSETPLKDQVSYPEEQVDVILFLTSNAARMINGETIVVDGGLVNKGHPCNFLSLLRTLKET
ncbi:glucose 1-dehydrogenase [Plakobranchus ocellatus]|uniref:Glucose 1-dehydrogenase n=1 Tax=Plakobranchus ocellatus TaxID=259542 RepID=A0AAV4AZW2_9GAST|nr:glucose 1-dehydrogenase [Plakobranchus ocellatus]